MLTILGSRDFRKARSSRDSRKIRNPRYAPELLERKLSLSTLVCSLTTTTVVSTDPLPPPPPPPPPIGFPPIDPTGPVGPA
jgi:hypothetical protein